MIGRKTLGRALFFGLGYVVGTRAGRERYAQIEAGARALVAGLRGRLDGEDDGGSDDGGRDGESRRRPGSSRAGADPYGDIRLGG
ncbi:MULTISPECIES: hypothetical protein [unclassified Isoptericola]|uniref:hypothetical protein n=1 Tax=unclassified Isoptericola TaxID=2623355 RepID=UPI0035E9E67F|nr:hypothetical protein [Isoptericola sp. QY 916]